LTQLSDYMQAQVDLLPTMNASVRMALPVLAIARTDKVAEIVQRALDAQVSVVGSLS